MTPPLLLRSVLYTPASRIDRVRKALEAGKADLVVADLEDGTAPSERGAAREEVRRLMAELRAVEDGRFERLAVRINPYPGSDAKLDLAALDKRVPNTVVVPKVESPTALGNLRTKLGKQRPRMVAMIETANGLLHADVIARQRGTVALVFGSEDYAADVGATRTADGLEVLYARSRVVACAASAGIEAIDQIWADYKDLEGLRRDATFGARLGFAGKQVIHPDQIPVVHEAFRPAAVEVERARRIVAMSEAAQGGVVVVDGKMIDRPLVEQARRVLRRAEAGP